MHIILDKGSKRIVRETRNVVWVADENGIEKKYRLESPMVPRKKRGLKNMAKPKPKPKMNKKKYEILAAKLPQCKVVVHNMTSDEIEAQQAKQQREYKINAIVQKIKTLSGE